MEFKKKQPCKNCPYRKDAPLKLWHKAEFENLLKEERTENVMGSKIFACHKKDESVCVGWLINQRDRNFPSINLRLVLIKKRINYSYTEGLKSPVQLYQTIEEMILANYPEILNKNQNAKFNVCSGKPGS